MNHYKDSLVEAFARENELHQGASVVDGYRIDRHIHDLDAAINDILRHDKFSISAHRAEIIKVMKKLEAA